jgi:cystathionine beta-synthase
METVGNTPLVKLNSVVKGCKATVLAKIETVNPGNSIKDRMAMKMIEDAEQQGLIKPGATIIEGTSGNTGMGLALGCILKGYNLICVLSDKQSKEKMDILRAVGAEVVVCPTNVDPEDPRSYYSVSKRLAKETPNSWYVNQYDNPSNALAHYEQTGPEIWGQTEGEITHLLVGVGTGGTISGTGKYLKEQNPKIQNIGIDTYGSVFKKYHETGVFDENEIYSYITEGIGEDILPKNVDFSVIDHFEKVTDKDAAVMTRRITREEGIFVGNSAGSAIAGLMQIKDQFTEDDIIVVIFHDHGSRYVGKMFNDDWMRERGFLDVDHKTAIDLIENHLDKGLIQCASEELVSHAISKMKDYSISQIPITKDGGFVGHVDDTKLFQQLLDNPSLLDTPLENVMQKALPVVKEDTKIEDIKGLINHETPAVLVELKNGKFNIITRYDMINAL